MYDVRAVTGTERAEEEGGKEEGCVWKKRDAR